MSSFRLPRTLLGAAAGALLLPGLAGCASGNSAAPASSGTTASAPAAASGGSSASASAAASSLGPGSSGTAAAGSGSSAGSAVASGPASGAAATASSAAPAASTGTGAAGSGAASGSATSGSASVLGVSPSASLGGEAGKPLTVPLRVVQAPGGATLALIPVTIEGQGPFAFALDTGASVSTIDSQLAQKLGLPNLGSAGQISGVAATTQAQQTEVKQWKIGSVNLPPAKIVSVNLGGNNSQAGLAGLVGSDILSGYGAATVDYDQQVLILRPHVKQPLPSASSVKGTQTVPLKVVSGPSGSTLALIPVTIQGQGPFPFAVDTGASNSTIDTQLAQKLGLPELGAAGQITGVAATTQAQLSEIKQWQIGSVKLPQTKVISVNLGGSNAAGGLAGLVGSDILSSFGAVTVDYDAQALILRPHIKRQLTGSASPSAS